MPIFEFECHRCHETFERIVRYDEPMRCPSCDSDDIERLLSTFAVRSKDLSRRHVTSAKQRLERTHREQRQAEAEDLLHHDD